VRTAASILFIVVPIAIAGCRSPRAATPASMVWIGGGTFWMGCQGCGMPDALPAHRVSFDGFWMDRTPVTNAEFERFVNATGYATVAERQLDPKDFPRVPRDKLVPGSAVFHATSHPVALDNPLQWWQYTAGASWRHPEGPGSGVQDRLDHPVVHIAFEDALAYAEWADKRLPTEAEFEFAARGGLDRNLYPWGNELNPGGRAVANTWQGQAAVRRLVPARLLHSAGEGGSAREQPTGSGRQLRPAGGRSGQTGRARRILLVHQSVLCEVSGRQPRQSRSEQRSIESRVSPGPIAIGCESFVPARTAVRISTGKRPCVHFSGLRPQISRWKVASRERR